MAGILAVMILAGCTGPAGPAGAAGETGERGPAGPQGEPAPTPTGDGTPGSTCASFRDCAGALVCSAGTCSITVGGFCDTSNDQCVSEVMCLGGICSDGSPDNFCTNDFQCTYNCSLNSCTDGASGSSCNHISHCIYACVSNLCSDGGRNSACSNNDHCAGSLTCQSGTCQ